LPIYSNTIDERILKMAASFPNAKKTFSAVVNGVTKLVAALFNSPYDEIEAIETFIGATGGGAQAYYTSLPTCLSITAAVAPSSIRATLIFT